MKKPMSTLAILGFVLAFVIPIAGLIVSVCAIHEIENAPMLRGRAIGGHGLAMTGVAIAGITMLVTFGVLMQRYG